MGYRGTMPVDYQLKAQVTHLRKMGWMVNDICQQLGLHLETERAAVQAVCASLPRRYQVGIECEFSKTNSRLRRGNWA